MDTDGRLRLLYMEKILYELTDEDHFLTISQIKKILEDEYGISSYRQTVQRDIEALRQFGMDIKEVKSTQNRYNLVSRKFDLAELKLLIDAVESARFITEKKSAELTEKISSLAGKNQAERLRSKLFIHGRSKSKNEKIYLIIDAINDAINEHLQIKFVYIKHCILQDKTLSHIREEHTISPLSLVWNGDCYYLIGIGEDGSFCNFRVDRIAACPEILETGSVCSPESFDTGTYISNTMRSCEGEKVRVELKCAMRVLDAIVSRFGSDMRIIAVDDESFVFSVETIFSHGFIGWIFSFGGLVKVVGPKAAIERFNNVLKSFG